MSIPQVLHESVTSILPVNHQVPHAQESAVFSGRGWRILSYVQDTLLSVPAALASAAKVGSSMPGNALSAISHKIYETRSRGQIVSNSPIISEAKVRIETKEEVRQLFQIVKFSVTSEAIIGESIDPTVAFNALRGIGQDNAPAFIENSNGEQLEVPYVFSIDGPRSKFYINGSLVKGLDETKPEIINNEELFAFCEKLSNEYGKEGYKNILALSTQSIPLHLVGLTLTDLSNSGREKSISQAPNSHSSNSRKDQEGNIHIKHSLVFVIRDKEDPEYVESFRKAEIEIIIPKSEIEKDWSQDSEENSGLRVVYATEDLSVDDLLKLAMPVSDEDLKEDF